jgi:serine/threonine protein kinase
LTDICANANRFTTGGIDLLLEAKILSKLSHANIIQVYGVKAGRISDFFNGDDGGFFLIEELLTDTLDTRLDKWHDEEHHQTSWSPDLFRVKRNERRLQHRLSKVAIGIANGMQYLHQHRIIFRDLKPLNVGFAEDGNVRLFDFG